MPVVFVHGVNNRAGPEYDAGCLAKAAFLKTHLAGAQINGKTLGGLDQVSFPYWGDLGTSFAWNMASLPKGGVQQLGGSASGDTRELAAQLADAIPQSPGTEPLTALAKRDFVLAVDALAGMALSKTQKGKEKSTAAFVVAAQEYATKNPKPAWVAGIATDTQLIARLMKEISPAPSAQALGNPFANILAPITTEAARLKQMATGAAKGLVDKAGDFASTKLLGFTREPLNGILGRFFGDVFIYMSTRGEIGAPGAIPKVILDAIDAAQAAAPAEPLVIVGHSLGGVITFDLLGSYRPDIECDLFISVGSQVGHFEEIKLYRSSDKAIGTGKRAKTPPNIKRWINVYDEVDIFSYACAEIFDRIDLDVPYDTKTFTVKAHGAYFDQDRFYQRLRARIDTLP